MDPASRLYLLLERIGHLLRVEARQLPEGLDPIHAHALTYLARANRFSDTAGAVAAYLGVGKGSVSQSLALLGRRGLLTATVDPQDRRRRHLSLTRKGKAVVARLLSAGGWAAAAATLGPAADRLEGDLTRLLAALQQGHGGRTFGVCATCRHLVTTGQGLRCGLTDLPLSRAETAQICQDHAPQSPP